jgi:hypothetical protein
MPRLKWYVAIPLIVICVVLILIPRGRRMATLKEFFAKRAAAVKPAATPEPKPTQPAPVVSYERTWAKPQTLGSMDRDETVYTVPAAIVTFGSNRLYLDPASPVRSEATPEYPIKVQLLADGYHVTGRKLQGEWRHMPPDAPMPLGLRPITRMY